MYYINRLYNQLYAFFNGYFWLPCPLCGKYFGGHEQYGELMISWNHGKLTCFDCKSIADKENEKFIKNNPPIFKNYC
jgi:hypothetical protein